MEGRGGAWRGAEEVEGIREGWVARWVGDVRRGCGVVEGVYAGGARAAGMVFRSHVAKHHMVGWVPQALPVEHGDLFPCAPPVRIATARA